MFFEGLFSIARITKLTLGASIRFGLLVVRSLVCFSEALAAYKHELILLPYKIKVIINSEALYERVTAN